MAAEERRRWLFDEVRALYDLPGEAKTPILLRGDALTPGPLVEPGVISTLDTPEAFQWTAPASESKTSGKRLAFARWLTQSEHPLTARVMVNRIWMHHFGIGLVDTPDDFGVSGSPPSHPELLDWLASEFVLSGWSIKNLHRLILTSATWRQSSRVSPERLEAGTHPDPDNRLYWRYTMRRLDAEALRDNVLAASGMMDKKMFGVSQAVARQQDGEVIVPVGAERNRRSIYVKIKRLHPETMLQVFDQPKMSVNCTERTTSTVSTQALTMLNGDTMTRAAVAFAERVVNEYPEDPVRGAFLIAYSRHANDDEYDAISQFVDEQASRYLNEQDETIPQQADVFQITQRKSLTDLCHMLMSSNEFVYVD